MERPAAGTDSLSDSADRLLPLIAQVDVQEQQARSGTVSAEVTTD
ncbi:hypothetical protein [Haloarcula rubripromontorii]|nr:hypothetical protein [Haloarcula rubripromontorii]